MGSENGDSMDLAMKHALYLKIQDAAKRCYELGEAEVPDSDFANARALGQQIKILANEIQKGNPARLEELSRIFAPEGPWYRAGGGRELGERIYEEFTEEYKFQ